MYSMHWAMTALVTIALTACGGGDHPKVSVALNGTGGGTVALTLLQEDGSEDLAVTGDGNYTFPESAASPYFLLVKNDPAGVTCVAMDDKGYPNPVGATRVTCAPSSVGIGGAITSDPDIGDVLVELRNTVSGESLTLANSGDFAFTQPVSADGNYNVVVESHSAGVTCAVKNGSGAAHYEVANIEVLCASASPSAAARRFAPMADVVAPSPGASITIRPPQNLKAVFDNSQFIYLTWESSSDPQAIYRVFEDKDGLGPSASVQLNAKYASAATHWTMVADPSLVLAEKLLSRYYVQACANEVCTPVSEPVSIDFSKLQDYVGALDRALRFTDNLLQYYDGRERATYGHMERDWQGKPTIFVPNPESVQQQAELVKNREITFKKLKALYDIRIQYPGACPVPPPYCIANCSCYPGLERFPFDLKWYEK